MSSRLPWDPSQNKTENCRNIGKYLRRPLDCAFTAVPSLGYALCVTEYYTSNCIPGYPSSDINHKEGQWCGKSTEIIKISGKLAYSKRVGKTASKDSMEGGFEGRECVYLLVLLVNHTVWSHLGKWSLWEIVCTGAGSQQVNWDGKTQPEHGGVIPWAQVLDWMERRGWT